MSVSRSSSEATQFLKCFCGCTPLTTDQVKKIWRMTAKEILDEKDPLAKRIFLTYLENERGNCPDSSSAKKNIEIYDLCENIILKLNEIIPEDEIRNLLELKYDIRLKESVESEDRRAIESCVREIQTNCCNEIEESDEYEGFKIAIKDKLKNFDQ